VLPESHKDAGLLRFNSLGELSWVQNYGSTTSTEDARACVVGNDGNFAYAGYAGYHYDDKNTVLVVKSEPDGDTIWSQTYGDPQKWHIANWMGVAGDGDYIIAGETETETSVDALAMKVSADDGDVIWQKHFGGIYFDSFIDGIVTTTGDIILVGYKEIDDQGARVPWLVRLDADGQNACEIQSGTGTEGSFDFGIEGPLADKYIITGDWLSPYEVIIGGSDLSDCAAITYNYVPGDANMINAQWKPQVIGGDVTYLVGYFRGINVACKIGGFFGSADVNGDCSIIGSDVTRLVTYFRGLATLSYCPDYQPTWVAPDDCPEDAPANWPGCE
jgi:hypothetical protein